MCVCMRARACVHVHLLVQINNKIQPLVFSESGVL
jgi:hypothetical protein